MHYALLLYNAILFKTQAINSHSTFEFLS